MLTTEACLDCNHLVFEVSGTNNYVNRDPFCCPLVWQHFPKVFNCHSMESSTLLFLFVPLSPNIHVKQQPCCSNSGSERIKWAGTRTSLHYTRHSSLVLQRETQLRVSLSFSTNTLHLGWSINAFAQFFQHPSINIVVKNKFSGSMPDFRHRVLNSYNIWISALYFLRINFSSSHIYSCFNPGSLHICILFVPEPC